jgi:hypothetical protein
MAHDEPVYGALFSRDEDRGGGGLEWKPRHDVEFDVGALIGNGTVVLPDAAVMLEGRVVAVQDESRIPSWSGDKTLRLWDRATGRKSAR